MGHGSYKVRFKVGLSELIFGVDPRQAKGCILGPVAGRLWVNSMANTIC